MKWKPVIAARGYNVLHRRHFPGRRISSRLSISEHPITLLFWAAVLVSCGAGSFFLFQTYAPPSFR